MDTSLESFCLLAKNARGRAAVQIIHEATAAPGLFAFGELLDMPNVQQLKEGEFAQSFELLRLFAHGTWPDYKASAANLPTLNDAQVLKLKQLTVVALAEGASTLPYEAMMTHLEVPTVRQLEDLLINDCMYTGIVRGKLDQQKRCLEVHYAAGRDIRPGQLVKMLATLKSWTTTSQQLLHTIDDKVKWAGEQSAERVKHKEALEARVEDKKKKIKPEVERAGADGGMFDGSHMGMDLMPIDHEERMAGASGSRSKRRR